MDSFKALRVEDDEDEWEVKGGSDEPASISSNRRADAYSGTVRVLFVGEAWRPVGVERRLGARAQRGFVRAGNTFDHRRHFFTTCLLEIVRRGIAYRIFCQSRSIACISMRVRTHISAGAEAGRRMQARASARFSTPFWCSEDQLRRPYVCAQN